MSKLNIAEQYMEDISKDRIPACEYVKLAVQRQYKDLKDGLNRGLFFDRKAGEKAINYFNFLKFTQGRQFFGKQFILSPPQAFIQFVVFGWKRANGWRRFRHAYIEVPRKFGKTTYAAGNALMMLDADNEPSAEIFSIATKEEQARKCFREAKNMLKVSPLLSKRITPGAKQLYVEDTFSFFRALGADSKTEDSHNPHFVVVDEYHAHVSDEMVDVMQSGMGARVQPLIMYITTAGFNINSVCYDERERCIKILRGILEQDDKFAIIYTLDENDDWEDEANWIKSQPHLGTTVSLDEIRGFYKDAKNRPSKINNFKTKTLNIWTNSEKSFTPDSNFVKCNYGITWEQLKGQKCYAGIDLASNMDINALSLFFPFREIPALWLFYWCPEVKINEDSDGVTYKLWKKQGWMKSTHGNVIDIDEISHDILEIFTQVEISGFAFDPAKAYHGVIQNIQKGIINHEELLHPFRQGFISMDTPTKEFQNYIMGAKIDHGGNPVLRWNNSNSIISIDPAGNYKLDKKKSKNKIDGMISSVMAIGEYMTPQDNFNEYIKNHYEETGSIL